MQALVLVGGEGTRLRPLTRTVPKPIIPLVDRPFLRYMLDWLGRHGVEEVILSIGFLARGVREGLGEEIPGGPRIRYVEEPDRRGTAGAIKFAEELLEDRFLALNGDVLTDLDLGALVRRHEEAGAVATLALYPVDDPTAYGLVRRAEDGEILEFLEKPEPDQIDTDEISAGAYVLERSVLDLIPSDREVSIEREVFPRLVGEGLYAERLEGYWMDIGTPERYLQASWDILEGRVETEVAGLVDAKGTFVADGAEIADRAAIERSVFVHDGARVGEGATVGGRAVVGPECELGGAARVEGSVLMSGCELAPEAVVSDSVLAADVRVGEGAAVGAGSVIGEGAAIEPGAEIPAGSRIEPRERVA